MTSQILIKLLRAILRCPFSFLLIDWQPYFLVNERCWGYCISGLISYISASFYVWYAVFEFSNVKCFHSSRKYDFWLLLGCFFGHNSPRCGQILLKFWPIMQCKVLNQICDGFWCKFHEIKHKTLNLWLILTGYLSSYALSVTPQILCQKKGIINLHKPAKYHFKVTQIIVTPEAMILGIFWVVFHKLLH